jgi:hypothetical protein
VSVLTLAELGRFVTEHYRRDVLRVETRQRYDTESERDDLRRYLAGEPTPSGAGDTPWIRQLRAHAAAGRSWRVLHAVRQPLSDYLRYECEWGYVHNAAAGQSIRIAELTDADEQLGDLLVVDGAHVFRYRYDEADRFVDAEQVTDRGDVARCLDLLERSWSTAEPFASWWAAHPQYHRDPRAA